LWNSGHRSPKESKRLQSKVKDRTMLAPIEAISVVEASAPTKPTNFSARARSNKRRLEHTWAREDDGNDDDILITEETGNTSGTQFSSCGEDLWCEGCQEGEFAAEVHSLHQEVYSRSTPAVPSSILLYSSSPLAINERGPWRRLPKPNMNLIEQQRIKVRGRDDAASKSKRNRKVLFDKLTVRYYSRTVGDNPSVSCGPPIQLDWDYEEQPQVRVDEYEGTKNSRRSHPRHFCMNYFQRFNILSYCCGLSEAEIKQAERNVDKVRRERNATKLLAPFMIVEDFFGSAARKTKRLITSCRCRRPQNI
jgi:hypothetical protein